MFVIKTKIQLRSKILNKKNEKRSFLFGISLEILSRGVIKTKAKPTIEERKKRGYLNKLSQKFINF
jgi:hypothetical protein